MNRHYEVYVSSVHGSDVYTCYDINEAIAEACKWSQEVEEDVVIEIVETKIGYRFRNGNVIFDHNKGWAEQ